VSERRYGFPTDARRPDLASHPASRLPRVARPFEPGSAGPAAVQWTVARRSNRGRRGAAAGWLRHIGRRRRPDTA